MKACPGLRSRIASRIVTPTPKLVFPAKAGIQKGRGWEVLDCHAMKKPTRHHIFILLCGLRKAMVIPAIESMPRTPIRGRNPGVEGWHKTHPNGSNNQPHFHTLVCRPQPG